MLSYLISDAQEWMNEIPIGDDLLFRDTTDNMKICLSNCVYVYCHVYCMSKECPHVGRMCSTSMSTRVPTCIEHQERFVKRNMCSHYVADVLN